MVVRHAALVGTTASGKSAAALGVARSDPDWEIVSIDSMQVYRGMDIGTAKPTTAERLEVAHHLIDLVEPSAEFTVADFRDAYDEALADIEARGRRALLVGGTGLYLRAVVDRLELPGRFPDVIADLAADESRTPELYDRLVELDPVAASRVDAANERRIVRALEVTIGSGRPFSSFGPGLTEYRPTEMALIGLRVPADIVRERIERRYAQQMEAGFLDEVRRLAASPGGLSRSAGQALGYKEFLGHLRGECSAAEALEVAVRRTKRFARRQRSWFGRDPRITWFDVDDPAKALAPLLDLLEDS